MNRTLMCIILINMLFLTACSDTNASMYEVKQEPQVTNEESTVNKGVATIEALVADNANSDKALGTKHVVIIDGVPYAELDGTEHAGEKDTYKAGNDVEKSKTQEENKKNIDDAINNIFNTGENTDSKEQETEEKLEEASEEIVSNVLERFLNTSESHGMIVDYTTDIDRIRDISNKYGVYIDKKDNGKEIGIAYDVENVLVIDIVTYDNITDVELAFALNNRYTYSINGMELIEADTEHSIVEIHPNKTSDENTSVMEFHVFENLDKEEYYIIGATYIKNNSEAYEMINNIINEIK